MTLILSSCAKTVNRKENIDMAKANCSDDLESYMNSKVQTKNQSRKRNPNIDIVAKRVRQRLSRDIRACYDWALKNQLEEMYEQDTCFVVGYNKQGEQEIFGFSHKKRPVNQLFGKCLQKLQGLDYQYHPELKDYYILALFQFKIR